MILCIIMHMMFLVDLRRIMMFLVGGLTFPMTLCQSCAMRKQKTNRQYEGVHAYGMAKVAHKMLVPYGVPHKIINFSFHSLI